MYSKEYAGRISDLLIQPSIPALEFLEAPLFAPKSSRKVLSERLEAVSSLSVRHLPPVTPSFLQPEPLDSSFFTTPVAKEHNLESSSQEIAQSRMIAPLELPLRGHQARGKRWFRIIVLHLGGLMCPKPIPKLIVGNDCLTDCNFQNELLEFRGSGIHELSVSPSCMVAICLVPFDITIFLHRSTLEREAIKLPSLCPVLSTTVCAHTFLG